MLLSKYVGICSDGLKPKFNRVVRYIPESGFRQEFYKRLKWDILAIARSKDHFRQCRRTAVWQSWNNQRTLKCHIVRSRSPEILEAQLYPTTSAEHIVRGEHDLNSIKQYIGTLRHLCGQFRKFCTLSSGIGCSSSLNDRVLEMSGLTPHTDSLPFYYFQALLSFVNPVGSDSNEQAGEYHIGFIPPVFTRFRHGSRFADDYGFLCICIGWGLAGVLIFAGCDRRGRAGRCLLIAGIVLDGLATTSGCVGCLPWDWWSCLHDGQEHSQRDYFHSGESVTRKSLTSYRLCNTFSDMANVLSAEKQTAIIAALAEGSSIRSIERITGVHRDTIMRLGVKVGQGCTALLDEKMRNLPCRLLQFDEVWGFIGKKERHVRPDDDPQYGDVWTFCAIDAETKLVPSFKCGKRNLATAKVFVEDVQSRMANRVQISADALRAYQDAIEQTFGADVDFGQIIKTYEHDHAQHPELKYSAPRFVSVEKRSVTGSPDMDLVSTSYIERLNATTRLHMRRLTRLTLAFSKKLENFEAAVGLHFAYYNLVKRHGSLRMTPAMAAGIERDFWSVADLVEATA